MNKKLSIIMLLSCVGNVFSIGDDKSTPKTTKAKLKELPSKIYVSTADFADSKTGVALAGAACTGAGFKLLELPASQNALFKAKELLKSSKEIGYAYVCKAGSATCSFLGKAGSDTLSKASSVSREAVEFITQHKVGACVAGAVTVGGAAYGLYKYKKTTAATKQAESARRKLQEAELAQVLSDFLADFGGDVNGDNGQRSPLVVAAESNNLPLVKLLITAGADVNQKLSAGEHADRDALYFATHWGRPEIVEVLLAAGADNFDGALLAAESNKDQGHPGTGTPVEYQACINLIEKYKKILSGIARIAGGGAARSN